MPIYYKLLVGGRDGERCSDGFRGPDYATYLANRPGANYRRQGAPHEESTNSTPPSCRKSISCMARWIGGCRRRMRFTGPGAGSQFVDRLLTCGAVGSDDFPIHERCGVAGATVRQSRQRKDFCVMPGPNHGGFRSRRAKPMKKPLPRTRMKGTIQSRLPGISWRTAVLILYTHNHLAEAQSAFDELRKRFHQFGIQPGDFDAYVYAVIDRIPE